MSDLWADLPPLAQDLLWTLALLLPGFAAGALVLRGYAPWPLVRAMLRRFRWPSALFVLLIAISVGMGVGILAQERGLRRGAAAAADKFDLIVAAPGSEVTAMLAAVYLQPSDMALLSGETYAEIAGHEHVAIAAPLAFGDSFGTAPLVGTTAEFVRHLSEDRIEGRLWQAEREAVAGAFVPLAIGDDFTPAHGMRSFAGRAAPEDDEDAGHAHEGEHLTIVGRMAPTGTPWDRAILLPVEAVWEVHGLANGHAPEQAGRLGPPFDPDYFPGAPAVVVHAEALWANYALRSAFTRDARMMAFFPGAVLADLYRVMGDLREAMSAMALVTQALVASSVLLGLFILSRLFGRQIALLRALGAPARFVFAVVWSFGATLLLAGAGLGLAAGMGAAAVLSRIVTARTDVLVEAPLGWSEIHFLAGFVSLALLLSLAPAAAALRRPVVEGLRA